MKKFAQLFLMSLILFSCGKEKKSETEINETKESIKTVLIIDGTYIKDDEIKVFYKENGYFNYDRPTVLKITGSELIQRLRVDLPADINMENFSITATTNKEQKTLVIKGLSVEINGKLAFDGTDYKHVGYFNSDESFSWDEKNQRCNVVHTNKYPPGIVGSDKLEALLIK